MITGTGIDIVNLGRISRLLEEHGERFIDRVLSPEEKTRIPKIRSEEYIAGRFAAKEALAKATTEQFTLTKISVFNDEKGKPYFSGDLLSSALKSSKIHLSITHDTDYAAAFVVIEKKQEK
ncbi:MAG TPA: holo-ACP synthase [Spirochaetota bacterium]|nr:holo-ACP synthase [Spirochaetota bacterium]